MGSRTLGPLLHSLYRFCALHEGDSRTDADLLECFTRAGDQEAFAALVLRHGPMVLAVCQRLLPDRHEAEDAFQATFLVLVRKSAALRQPQQLSPWLHGVAHRIALRLRRKAGRLQPMPEGLDLAEARGPGALDHLVWQEVRTILDEEIERLPSKYRLPVVLCYLQGQSYSEAARSLGWPAGTLSVRLARARQILRDRFVRRGLGLSTNWPGNLRGQEGLPSPVPAALLMATVNAGACIAAGASALAGVVSQQVITLAEGALQTMCMTKLKTTLFLVLVAGLVCTGVGGLAWHPGPQARAEAPPVGATEERAPAQTAGEPDDGKDLDKVERQLKALQDQVQEKQRQLYKLREGGSLEQIEAALRKLHQANAGDPQRRAAVLEFEQAFDNLKQGLGAKAVAVRHTLRDHRDTRTTVGEVAKPEMVMGEVMVPIVSDGRVLQVDLEKKQVLLSSGSKDGIKNGQLFRVYQSGKMSPDQTGWVRITRADSKWSIGTIIQEYSPRAPMRANDIIQRHDGKEPEGMGGRPGAP